MILNIMQYLLIRKYRILKYVVVSVNYAVKNNVLGLCTYRGYETSNVVDIFMMQFFCRCGVF